MTDTVERLEGIVARLEALGLSAPSVSPSSVLPDGTPGPVASGEIIESAWGNSVVATLKRNVGCSYAQGGQAYTTGQQTTIVWGTQYYDYGVPPLAAAGATTFTIPPNQGGTWTLQCQVRSDPGAPSQQCDVYLVTAPALTVQPIVGIAAGKRGASLTWVGYMPPAATFSWGFYNGHSGALTLAAQMEARWVGF